MNLDELVNKITSEGCFPIPVKRISVKDTDRDLIFTGDLEGFLKAAKAMKAEVIFVASATFDEDEFIYEFDEDDEDESEGRENEGNGMFSNPQPNKACTRRWGVWRDSKPFSTPQHFSGWTASPSPP